MDLRSEFNPSAYRRIVDSVRLTFPLARLAVYAKQITLTMVQTREFDRCLKCLFNSFIQPRGSIQLPDGFIQLGQAGGIDLWR